MNRAAAGARGHCLVGVVAGLAATGLLVASAAGLSASAAQRQVDAATRSLARQVTALAGAAVGDGRDRALVFPPDPGIDEPFRVARDGQGDGVSRSGVDRGVDPAGVGRAVSLDQPLARIGSPPWPGVPDLPPRTGSVGPATPALRFGASRMISLKADGRATPGSLFVTDGRRALCALVVHGGTARVKTFCYDRRSHRWRPG